MISQSLLDRDIIIEFYINNVYIKSGSLDMTILDLIHIYTMVISYLNDKDKRNLAYTCSVYKKHNMYTLFIKLDNTTFSQEKLELIAELSRCVSIYLDLEYCNRVRDISMLKHVHTLNLKQCHSILNISQLSNVKVIKPTA